MKEFKRQLANDMRDVSQLCVVRYCRGTVFETTNQPSGVLIFPGKRICRILLAAPNLQLTLKVHYQNEAVAAWAARSFSRNEAEVDIARADDFICEFVNFYAGTLRALFERAGSPTGISLPFLLAPIVQTDIEDYAKQTWILMNGKQYLGFQIEIQCSDNKSAELNALGLKVGQVVREFLSGEEGDAVFFSND